MEKAKNQRKRKMYSIKTRPDNGEDRLLDPDEIANTYLSFHRQNRSAWSWEIELRPWVEQF